MNSRFVRRFVYVLVFAAAGTLFSTTPSRAQAVTVPAELQAELLAKLAGYDRNFAERVSGTVHVLLVVKPKDPRSTLPAATVKSALSNVDRIAGLPHDETIVPYDGAPALAALCKAQHAAIVYITPGFDDEIDKLRASLTGVDVLSVSAVPDYVPRGVVLGFEVISGKPKITLNFEQAKEQHVNFKAEALNLMKVYR